jgi:L-ascorbate metabolism protein UlaG (beta-lactamase superfamily)
MTRKIAVSALLVWAVAAGSLLGQFHPVGVHGIGRFTEPSPTIAGDTGGLAAASDPGGTIREGQAVVRYLLHCGYAVRTRTKLLIFDYVRQTRRAPGVPEQKDLAHGWIDPDEIKDLDVYVFVTHSHNDHFDPVILEWQDRLDRVTYIFGWKATDDPHHYCLASPRARVTIGDMNIWTVNSHHSGVPEVAYLVQTDGLTIFHGGDWKDDYESAVDYLLTRAPKVDIAFLGAHTREWIVYALRHMKPRAVFPMHYGGEESVYASFARECADSGLEVQIETPGARGDSFRYP